MKKLVSACLMTVLSGMMLGGCQDMSPSNQRIGAAALGGAIGGGAGNHVGGGLGAGVGAAAGAGVGSHTKNGSSRTTTSSAIGAGIGDGLVTGKSIESMTRQPEMSGKIMTNMFISVGLIESIPIIAIVIAIVLVFANPFLG